jgi:electron transport complex protein RnfD
VSDELYFENQKFTVSPSPHLHSNDSVEKIMWTVSLALVPASVFGIIHFGLPALINILVSIVTAVGSEFMVLKIRNKDIDIMDGSAFLTGLLLAMCLPPSLPWYMTALGSAFAIVIAKHSMGGLGFNIFNPAHIGRAALMVSWPVAMTTWSKIQTTADAITSATPLNILKQQGYAHLIDTFGSAPAMYKALFFGFRNGSIGETSTLLIFLGGCFLIYKKYVNWEVPVVMIGTVGILTWIFGPNGLFTGDPLFHIMAGGLMIGAFFMATDMVTIPMTRHGQAVFALGCGILTVLIRLKGGYPEGVCYSILLMNSVTPLIDRLMPPRRFGTGGTH